jgi:hypothetical protein
MKQQTFKTIILFICFIVTGFSQSNVIVKPGQIINLHWNLSTEADVFQYAVFYVQGADTSLFPFNTGTDPDSLWSGNEPVTDWSYAYVWNNDFYLKVKTMPGISYLRLGVSGINMAGQYSKIVCIPKVISVKKPGMLSGVKIQ